MNNRVTPPCSSYVSATGLLPGLPTTGLLATTGFVVAAKPFGPDLQVLVQVHVPFLAVAANIAAGRWTYGALARALPNSSVLTSAYRTDGSPAGLHAALPCIPTGPLAAALAGLVLEMAAATR